MYKEAHEAWERAETISKKVDTLGDINPVMDLPRVASIVEEIFGKDFKVSKEPFGIRFMERGGKDLPDARIGVTGTYQITWGGDDHGPDHD